MKIKHPATLWVVFDKNKNHIEHVVQTFEEEPCQDSWCRKRYYALKRYHLHPGNEAWLKRENARYRRWLKVLVNPMSIATRIATWTEIRSKEPDLFKAKRRGSK